ncbi:hypothetical protein HCU64_00020 [Methylobacterium sp. C25]|uniref:helix-turn-helix domain-containing protein n=1 Tax=Methylobacterium sp. C25 TaxID=2721622 RepID=UPI001F1F9B2D|nr:helix-turn-helix domain-containing protein [Methylobacterium sp. C25]MCE4222124.1 hypothetical protein [Methylobacterium sp. C25]
MQPRPYVIPEMPAFLLDEPVETIARAEDLASAPSFTDYAFAPLSPEAMEVVWCDGMDETALGEWEVGRQWKPDRNNDRNVQQSQARAAKLAHLDFLHPRSCTAGEVILLDKDCRRPKALHPSQFRRRGQALDEAQFVSLNTFDDRRVAAQLASIRAVWADAELRKGSPFEGMDRRIVAEVLLARLKSKNIPFPSYILDSGRGLWPVWVFEGMCPGARKRVRAVINFLNGPRVAEDGTVIHSRHAKHDARVRAAEARAARIWDGFALDHAVRDVTRVHRLAGTVNPKSGTVVRIVWPASFEEAERVDFEALAAAVLPYGRAEVQAYRETKASKSKPAATAKPRLRMSRWGAIAADILTLARYLGPTGLEGRRDLVAYHVATAWSHMGQGDTAASWAAKLSPIVGLPEDELARYLSGVAQRLRRHEAGETTTWDGRQVSVLYSPSNAKVIESLGLTPDLAEAAGLTYLRPGAEACQAVPAKARKAAQRRREGRATREKQADSRATLARVAREMLADGIPLTDIAAMFGCARGTVYSALAANQADAVEAAATAIGEAGDSSDAVQSVSRHLMVPPYAPCRGQIDASENAVVPARRSKPKARPTAPKPKWPPHGPLLRLLAIYQYVRGCCWDDWGDMTGAAMVLEEEMLQGRKLHPAPAKPHHEDKLRARLARLRIDPNNYLPCPRPATRLH